MGAKLSYTHGILGVDDRDFFFNDYQNVDELFADIDETTFISNKDKSYIAELFSEHRSAAELSKIMDVSDNIYITDLSSQYQERYVCG